MVDGFHVAVLAPLIPPSLYLGLCFDSIVLAICDDVKLWQGGWFFDFLRSAFFDVPFHITFVHCSGVGKSSHCVVSSVEFPHFVFPLFFSSPVLLTSNVEVLSQTISMVSRSSHCIMQ